MNIADKFDSESVRRMTNHKTGKDKEIIVACLQQLFWELDGTKLTVSKDWSKIHVEKGYWSFGDPEPVDVNIRGDSPLAIIDDVMRTLGFGTPRDYWRLREKYDADNN